MTHRATRGGFFMPEIDFYKTLGVGRNASAEEIRKAYKKLARKYHPDVRPGDKDAADQFKKVQQAYSVLGDAEKRVQFDRFGHASNGGHSGPYRTAWATGGNVRPWRAVRRCPKRRRHRIRSDSSVPGRR